MSVQPLRHGASAGCIQSCRSYAFTAKAATEPPHGLEFERPISYDDKSGHKLGDVANLPNLGSKLQCIALIVWRCWANRTSSHSCIKCLEAKANYAFVVACLSALWWHLLFAADLEKKTPPWHVHWLEVWWNLGQRKQSPRRPLIWIIRAKHEKATASMDSTAKTTAIKNIKTKACFTLDQVVQVSEIHWEVWPSRRYIHILRAWNGLKPWSGKVSKHHFFWEKTKKTKVLTR